MSSIPSAFTPGALYIAGFAQARAPHVALLLPTDARSGHLVHIRIDRGTSPNWQYQHRIQKIQGDMFLSSLLQIHDVSAGAISVHDLCEAASAVPAPENDTFGECSRWVYKVVQQLAESMLLVLEDAAAEEEFDAFAAGNRAYARRDKFPNVAVSQFCS
ncbi:hypothetical protein OE88DRAFT_609830 [Heliocybe sulcata]|uniref:Uncharacterized protein n=1 Tax=Heliocybe sulcata TaxID=5364 RepID=A0A5C3NCF8_9AGAM|nr:hypothetical protein OE88DRAFT_609830 [Heliocybe sulcata]